MAVKHRRAYSSGNAIRVQYYRPNNQSNRQPGRALREYCPGSGKIVFATLYNRLKAVYKDGLYIIKEIIVANKKIERAKELRRKRKRREERLKQRIREAKAAAKS